MNFVQLTDSVRVASYLFKKFLASVFERVMMVLMPQLHYYQTSFILRSLTFIRQLYPYI